MSWGPSALFPQQLAGTARIPDYTGINDLSGTVTRPCQSERSQEHSDWTMSDWNISAAHWLDHVRVKDLSGTLTGLCQSERSQRHTDWTMSEWNISAAHYLDHVRVKDLSGTLTGLCQSERSQEHTDPCQSERYVRVQGLRSTLTHVRVKGLRSTLTHVRVKALRSTLAWSHCRERSQWHEDWRQEGWRTWNLFMVTSIVTVHVKRFCTITHMTFEYDVWVQVCAANVSVHEHVFVACMCGIPIWWI